MTAGLVFLAAARHFEPVQFLFHLMKRVVADLIAGPHGKDGLAGCLHGAPMDFVVRGTHSGMRMEKGSAGREACGKLLPNENGGRRIVTGDARNGGLQGAFAR